MTIRWKAERRTDARYIDKILDRAERQARQDGVSFDRQGRYMDILCVHQNGVPLRLKELANAERLEDLLHDVFGIANHLDRTTGRLKDHFLPRYAQRQTVDA